MKVTRQAIGQIRPGDVNPDVANRAARRIREFLAAHQGSDPLTLPGELVGDDALVVPRRAAVLLAQILGLLADGQGVQIIPDDAGLTTQQAADMLNVSRPYLIKLLESGEIPYRTVGRHRRVTFQDLREYKRRDDQHYRGVLDEMAALSQELDLP